MCACVCGCVCVCVCGVHAYMCVYVCMCTQLCSYIWILNFFDNLIICKLLGLPLVRHAKYPILLCTHSCASCIAENCFLLHISNALISAARTGQHFTLTRTEGVTLEMLERSLKNRFRWEWLDKKASFEMEYQLSDCFKKIDAPGQVRSCHSISYTVLHFLYL